MNVTDNGKEPDMTIAIEDVVITPAQAKEYLRDDVNTGNRRLDWKLVDLYARMMLSGEWAFVGDPIRMSVTGRLLDGQNRLQALILSGTSQRFLMISGLPDESQTYMDVGKRRTTSDVFTMQSIPYPTLSAAIVTLVLRVLRGKTLDNGYKIASSEVLAYYGEHAAEIDAAVRCAASTKALVPISPAILGLVHVHASRIADPFVVNEFFERLRTGADLSPGNPILAARNWFLRRKRDDLRFKRFDALFILARAWNAWAANEELHRVILPVGGVTDAHQIPAMNAPLPRPERPVTEDNPRATPRSKTRAERELEAKAKAS